MKSVRHHIEKRRWRASLVRYGLIEYVGAHLNIRGVSASVGWLKGW